MWTGKELVVLVTDLFQFNRGEKHREHLARHLRILR